MSTEIKTILGAFIGWMLGFLLLSYALTRTEPTVEVKHYLTEQDGYNYCPYCGEKLKEGEE